MANNNMRYLVSTLARNIVPFVLFVILTTSAYGIEVTFDRGAAEYHCKNEWTKRGVLDSNMYSYCMRQQEDGYAETQELIKKYSTIEPIELIGAVVSTALSDWAKPRQYQFNMVAYQIEKQGEAFLNIKWELENGSVSPAKYDWCKEKWINNGQWVMVEYCLEKE